MEGESIVTHKCDRSMRSDDHQQLHLQGKTLEAKSDLSRLTKIRAERDAAQAKRKAEAEGNVHCSPSFRNKLNSYPVVSSQDSRDRSEAEVSAECQTCITAASIFRHQFMYQYNAQRVKGRAMSLNRVPLAYL